MSEVVSLDAYQTPATSAGRPSAPRDVFFDRHEFSAILNLYGHMVARRSAEGALYRIVKTPSLARRQGAYAVMSAGGRVLKRGHTLQAVLKLFDRKRFAVV